MLDPLKVLLPPGATPTPCDAAPASYAQAKDVTATHTDPVATTDGLALFTPLFHVLAQEK
jgi:hypothetical protein